MTGISLGLALEATVAILLIVTIAYCYVVNKKLTALRSDQEKLKDIVGALDRATKSAEQMTVKLREAVSETQNEFDERVQFGRSTLDRLSRVIDEANNFLPKGDPEVQRTEPRQPSTKNSVDIPAADPQEHEPSPSPVKRGAIKTDMRLSRLMRSATDEPATSESHQSGQPSKKGQSAR